MAVSVTCPGCATSYPVTDEILGKTIRCKKCQETFVARATKTAVSAGRGDERITTKPSAKATVRDEYDDGPANGRTNGKAKALPARKPAKKGGNGALIAVGSIAGVLILGLAGALVWALNRDEPADNSNASAPPPKKVTFGAPETTVAPAATPESKPADPPKADPPKAVQAGKIEHLSLPGFERKRRPPEFDPVMVNKLKRQAVLILMTGEDGGAWGSGWVAEQDGDTRYIVTNAHVVGMKEKAKSPPDSLRIYFHSGTDDETILEGRLLAVDHDEDLAVIRVKGRDKKGNPLPDAFKLAPSYDLVPGQKLTIIGFPHGGNLKGELQDDPLKELRVEVKTRPSTVVGRISHADGSVKYIQCEGGADHGNSGGGVIDTNGNIVAVLVAGIPGTNMRFVIPSEYAFHLLLGRVLKVIPGQAVKSGTTVKVPFRVLIADPLNRIARLSGEVWAGKPGPIRSASLRQPDRVDGDGARVSVDLSYNRDQNIKLGEEYTAQGDLMLPPLKDGEVYWFQPHYTDKAGKERWGEAVTIEMGRYPVEAKPANLTVKHKVDTKLDDRRALEIESRHINSATGDLNIKASLTERIDAIEKNGDAKVTYQYADVRFKDTERDSNIRERFKGLLEQVKYLKSKAVLTKDGEFKSARPDLAQVMRSAQPVMELFNTQIMSSLESISLNLPNKEVSPGETWGSEMSYSLTVGRTTQNAIIRTQARYVGTRVRNGREEAVIELAGKIETDPNPGRGGGGRGGDGGPRGGDSIGSPDTGGRGGDDDSGTRKGIRGLGHGAVVVDLQTGLITVARTESDMAAIFLVPVPRRNGTTVDVRVHVGYYADTFGRRSLNKDKPPEAKPEELLPNQVRTYNPLVGAADPAAVVDAPLAAPTGVEVPTRVSLLSTEVADKVRKATVRIGTVKNAGGDEFFGSGWFAEPGLIVTSCRSVDMYTRLDRFPQKIEVTIDAGLPGERKVPAQVVSIDRERNIAILRVKGENLPEPLPILPSAALKATEKIVVSGFPESNFGISRKEVLEMGLDNRDLKITAVLRPTAVVGRVEEKDGSTKYVQYDSGGDDGSWGSAVVDEKGRVRLIHSTSVDNTEMRFGTPAEYAARMLQGYPVDLDIGYAFMDGSTPKMPVSILFADPLKRLKKAWVDCWVGEPGKPRQGSSTEPKAKPGDGPRMSTEVTVAPDKTGLFLAAKIDIPIPRIAPGQIYYFQPRFIDGTGEMQWGRAVPFAPDGPPVERKPAELLVKHLKNAAPRFMELQSSMVHSKSQLASITDSSANTLVATYAETVQSLTAKGDAVTDLKCESFKWTLFDEDFFRKYPELEEFFDPEFIRLVKQFLRLYQSIITKALFARDGHMVKHEAAMPNGLPLRALSLIPKFHDQMMLSLKALCIPLPNKQVDYGHTWTTTTNLFVPASNRYEAGVFEMRMKYIGVRDRGGRREAVIEIEGTLAKDKTAKSVEIKTKDGPASKGDEQPKPDDGAPESARFQYGGKAPPKDDSKDRRALYGLGRGHAYVDIDGGYVSECDLFIDLEVEVMVKDRETKREIPQLVSGIMEVGLKRLTSAGKAK